MQGDPQQQSRRAPTGVRAAALNIVSGYNLIAPVYDHARPLWAQWVMGRAEAYLEREVLSNLLTPQTRILDLGCGTGVNLARLRLLGLAFDSYTGLDLTPGMLSQASAKLAGKKTATYCRGDMRRLPFPNQSFDLVLSTWALSHFSPPQPVFDEARRVLKTAGTLVVLFWAQPPYPMRLVARVLAPLFLVRFVEQGALDCLGEQALIRRFAGGWGASVILTPHPERALN